MPFAGLPPSSGSDLPNFSAAVWVFPNCRSASRAGAVSRLNLPTASNTALPALATEPPLRVSERDHLAGLRRTVFVLLRLDEHDLTDRGGCLLRAGHERRERPQLVLLDAKVPASFLRLPLPDDLPDLAHPCHRQVEDLVVGPPVLVGDQVERSRERPSLPMDSLSG